MTSVSEAENEEKFSLSLFHHYKERDLSIGKIESLHRINLVSKLPSNKTMNNRKLVADCCTKFMSFFTEFHKVTGLLLLYPCHALHVIETTDRTILEIVKWLHRQELNRMDDEEFCSDLVFSCSKILVVSNCIGQRLYTQYSTKILDTEPDNINLFESNEPDYQVVIDLMLQVTKLGAYLYKEPFKDQKEYVPEIFTIKLAEILEKIRERAPELIPQQRTIGYLAELSKDSCLIKLDEYIESYEKPFSTFLDCDFIWPAQRNNFIFA